jgi:hypothetical protein
MCLVFLLNIYILLIPIRITESDADAELNTLKVMVKKAVSFFYPKDPSSDAQTPQLINVLPNQCRDINLANMKQAVSLTLSILKSLYPRADLDVAGDGFVMTCTGEESLKLVKDSAFTADRIIDMVHIDMS